MKPLRRLLTLLIVLGGVVTVSPANPTHAAGIVGNGTPTSCDEAALDAALMNGGLVTFDCGPAPHTIFLNSGRVINAGTTIDGGDLITLDGQNTTRIFRITASGALELRNITLSNGYATGFGGAIYNDGGSLTVAGCTIADSSTASVGGGIANFSGTIALTDATITGNYAERLGGGIYNLEGAVTLVDSTMSNNSAGASGGGIVNTQGTLEITDSILSGNAADTYAGGIATHDGTTALTGSILSGNTARFGGGIRLSGGAITLVDSTLSGNEAGSRGGGIDIEGEGTVTATDSTFSGNLAVHTGGAISVIEGGTTTVTSSTFNGNVADFGGGVYSSEGEISITNSTISGNTARYGGGVMAFRGTAAITSSTFSGNAATIQGGGIHRSIGRVKLLSTIIADSPSGSNCYGSVASLGSNISDDPTCNLTSAGDLSNTNPLLGPLQANGGPTLTHLPGAGSPAINAATCPSSVDQRGVSRPQGTDCDIGAVEVLIPVVAAPIVAPASLNEGQSGIASASFTADENRPLSCTVDYGDGSGQQAGVISGDTCTGPHHTYLDDDPSGTASDRYTVTVTVIDDDTGSGSNTAIQTVANLPPMIDSITTNGPVSQGQPATITVLASDAGVNDTLTYRFDCDGDGSYETAGTANQATCTLDPAAATSTIGIQVEDDDLGIASGIAEVTQTVILCVNRTTGAVTETNSTDGCTTGTVATTVPGAPSLSFCINRSTNELRVVFRGGCASSERTHIVPDNGPLFYCENRWTGELRFSSTATCGHYENSGVIPG